MLHDFYRSGEESSYVFNVREAARRGHDFKDFICPDYIERHSDYMILGGGVFAMKGFPMDYLTERIEARVRKPLPLEELNLIYAEDEPDKSVVGAAIYARSKMK